MIDQIEDQTKSLRMKLITTSLLATMILAGSSYFFFGGTAKANKMDQKPSGPPPANVVVSHARSMLISPHTVLPGTVVSVRDAVIASETSGKVLSVVYVGDTVDENGKLAEIDPRDAKQLVAQRRADLHRLESLMDYHSNYYKRVGEQENKLGIPEIGIAELKSNVETAKADVARARASLEAAETDLQRTSISAPFPGIIVSQEIQPGEFAQVGSPIARLVDTVNLEVSAQVPAALVQPIKAGTMLTISGMGKEILAPMRAIVPVGDAISRTMEVRVELKDSGLLVGSPVRVSLPSAEPKEVVAIPRDAVILRTGTQYVFVVAEDGKAEKRDVELGYVEGDMIEVIGDVAANDTVIIRGGERLKDGQAVAWEDVESIGEEVSLIY